MTDLNVRNYDEFAVEQLKSSDEFLNTYIEGSIKQFKETQDVKLFLYNLKCIIEAKSSVPRIAKKLKITKQGLYQMLDNQEFKLSTFVGVLNTLGLNLDIKPAQKKYKYL